MFSKVTKGAKISCEYADIIAPLAFAIYHKATLLSHAQAHFGVRWMGLVTFTDWLMGMPSRGRQSNLIDLLLWYIEMEHQ